MSNSTKKNKFESIVKYWKSLRDYENHPELEEIKSREFMDGEDQPIDLESMSDVSRRKFLALMTASTSFAVAACTNYRDKGKVVPYNKRPVGVSPGIANYYASTCTGCANACGTLIKTREGRPIKVDGNPDHPVNQGKICTRAQASILNLYDPERLQKPMKGSSETSWDSVDKEISSVLSGAGNKEIAFISYTITSPTFKKLLEEFQEKYPSAKVYSYELFNEENRRSAWKKCYGNASFPSVKWDHADVVLALEADFLVEEGNPQENARLFFKNRDIMNNPAHFNRLYTAEATFNSTSLVSDYRLRIKPDAQYEFVMGLLNEVAKKVGYKLPAGSGKYSLSDFAGKHNLKKEIVEHLIHDLSAHHGKAIVYAGAKLPEDVHVAVNALNEVLGASSLYELNNRSVQLYSLAESSDWDNLVKKMNGSQVAAVINLNANPVYHLPSDLGFEAALAKVPAVISLAENMSETTAKSNYVLPIHSQFEAWGDHQVRDGVYSLQQPVIEPLYKTRQKEEVILSWLNGSKENYHQYLMDNWEGSVFSSFDSGISFEKFWLSALHDGVIKTQVEGADFEQMDMSVLSGLKPTPGGSKFNVIFQANPTMGDGRMANNGWLQEIPHPISKVVWDNYAAISPSTAKELGVEMGDMLNVQVGKNSLQIVAYVQPGMADKTAAIALGYGRKNAGIIADDVGFNANSLLSKDSGLSQLVYHDADVSKAGGDYELVSTQEHQALEPHSMLENLIDNIHRKRNVIQEAIYKDFKNNKAHLHRHIPRNVSTLHPYKEVKWEMSIDLNKCIACTACVASCNAENNIPIVGKDQVKVNREMHWMRIDRYYSGDPVEPTASVQPMLCQHCDNAPCEYVCPVNATNHSPDGLNQMAYQRCVGTRYCANNCSYKVRRFNYFRFREEFKNAFYQEDSAKLVHNPEVTVRTRGVMEKCTFCVQRIMEARQTAIKENRGVRGDDVVTACQEACPTHAIQFGNSNDPNSVVSRAREHQLAYYVMEEINNRPNVTYLAKLRNIEEDHIPGAIEHQEVKTEVHGDDGHESKEEHH